MYDVIHLQPKSPVFFFFGWNLDWLRLESTHAFLFINTSDLNVIVEVGRWELSLPFMSWKTFFSCCRAAWAELNETAWKIPPVLGRGEYHRCSVQTFDEDTPIFRDPWVSSDYSTCTQLQRQYTLHCSCHFTLVKIRERKYIPPMLRRRDGRCQDDVRDSPLKSLHFRDEVKLFRTLGRHEATVHPLD